MWTQPPIAAPACLAYHPDMTAEDFQRLETLITREVGGLRTELRHGFARVDARIDGTNAELQALVGYLGKRFGRIDARFEQVDARFEQMDARFEQMDERFEQVDARFDRVEMRLTKVEVAVEGLRDDLRGVADGVRMNHEAIQRLRGGEGWRG